MIREFKNAEAYLKALKKDHTLAYVTISDAADMMGVVRSTVEKKLSRDETLDGIRIGRALHVLASEAIKFMDERSAFRKRVKRKLIEVALARTTISYGDFYDFLGLNGQHSNERNKLYRELGRYSGRYWRKHGIVISSLVTRKDGTHSVDFYEFLDDLGCDIEEDGYAEWITAHHVEVWDKIAELEEAKAAAELVEA